MVLLARDVRDDDVFLHARVEREAGAVHDRGAGRTGPGQDLVARLGLRRQGHDLAVGHRARLAAEPEPLLHLLVTELEGVLHGGRGHVAGEDLAAAASAAPARAARGVHADTRRLRRVEQRGAALDAHPAHRPPAVGGDEANFDEARLRHPAQTHASRGSFTSASASFTACTASRPQPSAPHSSAHSWVVGAPPTRIFTLPRCPAFTNSSIVTFW